MLILTTTLHNEIKAHGHASYPYEGCGVLLGRVEGGMNVVTAVRPLPNTWPVETEKPIRFRISEQDWLAAEMAAMMDDVDIIGIFHSHPDNPPIASPRDLAWASWSGYSYIITEVINGAPTHSRSWQLAKDRSGFFEELIKIGD
ncbi:MAG: M67 family metallopeptidase [Chloroflexota bacterium]